MKKYLFVIVLLGMTLAASGCGASDPGSNKILFSTNDLGENPITLFTMDPDGSNLTKVYEYEGGDGRGLAHFSADGSTVLLVDAVQLGSSSGELPNFRYDLVTVKADGSNKIIWADDLEATLTCMNFLYAQLSADGSRLLYNLPQGDQCAEELLLSGTYQMDPQVAYQSNGERFVSRFSEDGKTIIVYEDGVILGISSNDLSQKTLFSDENFPYLNLVSTHAGNLYFKATTDVMQIKLMQLDLGSGKTTTLYEGDDPNFFTIAPDGNSMLYIHQSFRESPLLAGCDDPSQRVAFGLYDFGSDELTTLSCSSYYGFTTRYSFDGKYVFADKLGVTVFNMQGEAVFENENGGPGVFSPNSHDLLYWNRDDPERTCLHKVNLDTGAEVELEASCQERGMFVRSLDWR